MPSTTPQLDQFTERVARQSDFGLRGVSAIEWNIGMTDVNSHPSWAVQPWPKLDSGWRRRTLRTATAAAAAAAADRTHYRLLLGLGFGPFLGGFCMKHPWLPSAAGAAGAGRRGVAFSQIHHTWDCHGQCGDLPREG